ncbi:MAG: GTP-binding protein [Rickettsiales bacterium]|nr:GTP-binding protein [Rickettsiales bacterium]
MSKLQHFIPITVITGFLGSGKTTLLSTLLKQDEMKRTAVIINEFGEIGLDHILVEHTDENIVELQNGCICCTIRGDLFKTLSHLMDKVMKQEIPVFDKVIIETTGLADPAPIIHTLMSSIELQRFYVLDGVITLVDAINGEHTLKTYSESLKQVAMAERIIISKTDLSDEVTQQSLLKRLKALNPAAAIIPGYNGNIPISTLFGIGHYDPSTKNENVRGWLAAEQYKDAHEHKQDHTHHHHDVNRHSDEIEAFSMTHNRPVNMMALDMFLNIVALEIGENLLRIKGIINVAGKDGPVVVHGVQHIFHPLKWLDAWPDGDKTTRLVFITRGLQREHVERFFKPLMGIEDENVTPKEVAEVWLHAS